MKEPFYAFTVLYNTIGRQMQKDEENFFLNKRNITRTDCGQLSGSRQSYIILWYDTALTLEGAT